MTWSPQKQHGASLKTECPLWSQGGQVPKPRGQPCWCSAFLQDQPISRCHGVEHQPPRSFHGTSPHWALLLGYFSRISESLLCEVLSLATALTLQSLGLGQVVTDYVRGVHYRKLPMLAISTLSFHLAGHGCFNPHDICVCKAVAILWKSWPFWLNTLRTDCSLPFLCSVIPFSSQ